jgi:arylsulfatase A-like enzyme
MNAKRMAVYSGMLEYMDMSIGRVLAHLDAKGMLDNTIVVFMSDNGAEGTELEDAFPDYYRENFDLTYEHLGEKGTYSEYGPGWANVSMTPFSGLKITTLEGGTRAPLIIRYPKKVAAGIRSDAFVYVLDVAPTLLTLAGVAPAANTDAPPLGGRSMAPLLTNGAKEIHGPDEVIATEVAGNVAVYRGRFKLVRNLPPYGDKQWRLYDLTLDPTEANDIAAKTPDVAKSLIAAYADYVRENGVIEAPDGYNLVEQAKKNSLRDDH